MCLRSAERAVSIAINWDRRAAGWTSLTVAHGRGDRGVQPAHVCKRWCCTVLYMELGYHDVQLAHASSVGAV